MKTLKMRIIDIYFLLFDLILNRKKIRFIKFEYKNIYKDKNIYNKIFIFLFCIYFFEHENKQVTINLIKIKTNKLIKQLYCML
jgi:hypothetical protein